MESYAKISHAFESSPWLRRLPGWKRSRLFRRNRGSEAVPQVQGFLQEAEAIWKLVLNLPLFHHHLIQHTH